MRINFLRFLAWYSFACVVIFCFEKGPELQSSVFDKLQMGSFWAQYSFQCNGMECLDISLPPPNIVDMIFSFKYEITLPLVGDALWPNLWIWNKYFGLWSFQECPGFCVPTPTVLPRLDFIWDQQWEDNDVKCWGDAAGCKTQLRGGGKTQWWAWRWQWWTVINTMMNT